MKPPQEINILIQFEKPAFDDGTSRICSGSGIIIGGPSILVKGKGNQQKCDDGRELPVYNK
jgi:hypothetical protein